jgi:outer membrane protein assembly factor BamB
MSNDPSQPPASAEPGAPPKRRSLLLTAIVPIVIVALEAVAQAGIHYAEQSESLSPANAFLAKASTAGAGVILLFAWFVLLAPVTRSTRIRVGLLALAIVALGLASLRIEDVSGDIVPRIRFRWSPHADEMLGKLQTDAQAEPVNLTATSATGIGDYPQFLGPNRQATLSGVGLARDWSQNKPTQLWRQPIGAAWSAFAVVGPFAVTQEQRGAEELITCYELNTGKARGVHSTPVRFQETLAGIGPRATPTIHGGNVYAMGALGRLTCLDGATGKQLWQHNVASEFHAEESSSQFDAEESNSRFDAAGRNPIWGRSGSPLIYDDLVIVSAGAPDGKSLVAFDKTTGELRWSGGDDGSSYSSPTVMTLCGVTQIVIVNATSVVGHDPADGRVLWQRAWPDVGRASPNVAQPVAAGNDRILLTKGYGTGGALWQINHQGDDWSVEQLWRANTLKTKFTNPVIHEGFVYALDEGILQCVDLETGRKKWKQGRYGHGQILLVDDLLLILSESGDVAIVEANPKALRELARFNALAGTCWNPPALAGRLLLVRSNEEAACYELPAASP